MEKFYITTAIDYLNAPPHMGHALEKTIADTLARYKRRRGDDVFFLTGTDEHGTKLLKAAEAAGVEPQVFCDSIVDNYKNLAVSLNISNDYFVRTTDESHKKAVQAIWKACEHDIYKGSYHGYYCVGCEAYLTESELDSGLCCIHHQPPEIIEEENYFFRLSKYGDALLEHFEKHPGFVYPQNRHNEIASLIRSGLEDISISRPRDKLKWGIEVPGDPEQVVYVWFDALTNYISALGYPEDTENFNKYWPADIHLIGKDILRFHAALWPAMLMSAGIPVPRQVLVHGFITVGSQKMSKTLGNVVDPLSIISNYGTDALRYYLLREIPATEDGDFTLEKFEARFNSDLANDLGNLVHRTAQMFEKFTGSVIPEGSGKLEGPEEELNSLAAETGKLLDRLMDEKKMREALEELWKLIRRANKYIEETAPWALAKTDPERLELVLYTLADGIRIITLLLEPFLPETAGKIWGLLGQPGKLEINLLPESAVPGLIEPGKTFSKGEPLFPRLL